MSRPTKLKETVPGFWRVLRHLIPYANKERFLVCGSLTALLVQVALRALEPWPLKLVIDHILLRQNATEEGAFSTLGLRDPLTLLTVASLAIVVIISLRALASYFSTVGFALVGNRVLTEVRSDLYKHLQCLSLSFHSRARGGDLVIRVISDIGMLKDVAVTALLPLLANLLILFCMAGLMLVMNWKLALLAFSITPIFWISTTRLSRRIRDASREQRKRDGAMASTAAESIGSIKVVQALSLEEQFAQTFSRNNAKSLKNGVKTSRLAARMERSVDVLIASATGLVLWYGTWLALRGDLTAGDLLVFLAYLKNAFKPVQDFAKYTGRLAKATAAGERVIELLDRAPDVRDLPGAITASSIRGKVEFQSVSFCYEPKRAVLTDVNFKSAPGTHIALVGASGNGKSTFVSLILRLYDPTTGRVMIDDKDVREYTLQSLRSQISVVMQDTVLFAASLRDNIAYGALGASSEEVEAAARLANIHSFIASLPQGYDTLVGERGMTLSAGQRQRIAVARAAVRNAPILILDEPTTGLDEENERIVVQALEVLGRKRTTFLITHNLRHAARADHILYFERGRILESGSHTTLMSAGAQYAALFELQSSSRVTTNPQEAYALSL